MGTVFDRVQFIQSSRRLADNNFNISSRDVVYGSIRRSVDTQRVGRGDSGVQQQVVSGQDCHKVFNKTEFWLREVAGEKFPLAVLAIFLFIKSQFDFAH